MIQIEVCIGCKCKGYCDFEDGIDLYEYIKSYIVNFIDSEEIAINLSSCGCVKECNGPLVNVNDKVYTNVDKKEALKIIKELALDKNKHF